MTTFQTRVLSFLPVMGHVPYGAGATYEVLAKDVLGFADDRSRESVRRALEAIRDWSANGKKIRVRQQRMAQNEVFGTDKNRMEVEVWIESMPPEARQIVEDYMRKPEAERGW